jgi:hypothetical protein
MADAFEIKDYFHDLYFILRYKLDALVVTECNLLTTNMFSGIYIVPFLFFLCRSF